MTVPTTGAQGRVQTQFDGRKPPSSQPADVPCLFSTTGRAGQDLWLERDHINGYKRTVEEAQWILDGREAGPAGHIFVIFHAATQSASLPNCARSQVALSLDGMGRAQRRLLRIACQHAQAPLPSISSLLATCLRPKSCLGTLRRLQTTPRRRMSFPKPRRPLSRRPERSPTESCPSSSKKTRASGLEAKGSRVRRLTCAVRAALSLEGPLESTELIPLCSRSQRGL